MGIAERTRATILSELAFNMEKGMARPRLLVHVPSMIIYPAYDRAAERSVIDWFASGADDHLMIGRHLEFGWFGQDSK